ncbi:MAG: crossover junction endodeoxyribonuclease RuvC [Planctomycetota bacterium]
MPSLAVKVLLLKTTFRILGIDPGTRVVGVGVIEVGGAHPTFVHCEAIEPKKTAPVSDRLLYIHNELERILDREKPNIVVIEQVYVGKSSPSAIRIGEGRGIALLCAARIGAEIHEYPPATVKRAIAGFGGADKEQVATWISRLLQLTEPPRPYDAADALALALTHAHRQRSPIENLRFTK